MYKSQGPSYELLLLDENDELLLLDENDELLLLLLLDELHEQFELALDVCSEVINDFAVA
jgi:hypothetical protein